MDFDGGKQWLYLCFIKDIKLYFFSVGEIFLLGFDGRTNIKRTLIVSQNLDQPSLLGNL